jgi:hypothetical protein
MHWCSVAVLLLRSMRHRVVLRMLLLLWLLLVLLLGQVLLLSMERRMSHTHRCNRILEREVGAYVRLILTQL